MTVLFRIWAGSIALLLVCIAGAVCVKVALRVHENIVAGNQTMLFGMYKMEGTFGYLIPIGVGFIALLCFRIALGMLIPRGETDSRS